jgi:hypothetical protein
MTGSMTTGMASSVCELRSNTVIVLVFAVSNDLASLLTGGHPSTSAANSQRHGIIGSGIATSRIFSDGQWDDGRAGGIANYVQIDWGYPAASGRRPAFGWAGRGTAAVGPNLCRIEVSRRCSQLTRYKDPASRHVLRNRCLWEQMLKRSGQAKRRTHLPPSVR